MDNDDVLIGRLLSRREALLAMGTAGLGTLVAACSKSPTASDDVASVPANATCVVRPQLTEGPYFVDERLNRSDIRSDPTTGTVKPGVLLALTFNIARLSGGSCSNLAGVFVDVWHCDALGLYSDESVNGTTGQKFLRGYQVTDANGVAQFTTIYPGWYQGRAVHIHFMVRSVLASSSSLHYTSQLFFPESVNSTVHAQSPYSQKGQRTVLNSGDGIYQGGGSQLLLDPQASGNGYAASINLAMQF